jgi:hypothetical protein
MMYGAEASRKAKNDVVDSIQLELQRLHKTTVVDENDELLRLLKEWAKKRGELNKANLQRELAGAFVEMEPSLLSGLIRKLMVVERSLKDLRKTRYKRGR